jgi:hypothetical protein
MKVVAAARLYLRKYTHNLKFQNKISALQTPPDKTQPALAWIFRPGAGKYWRLQIHEELGELLLRKDECSQVYRGHCLYAPWTHHAQRHRESMTLAYMF